MLVPPYVLFGCCISFTNQSWSFLMAYMSTFVIWISGCWFTRCLFSSISQLCSLATFIALRKQRSNILGRRDALGSSARLENEKHFLCTVAVLSLVAGVTQLPMMIAHLYVIYLNSNDHNTDGAPRILFSISGALLSVNFATNPFVYLWRIPKYKRTFKTLYLKK